MIYNQKKFNDQFLFKKPKFYFSLKRSSFLRATALKTVQLLLDSYNNFLNIRKNPNIHLKFKVIFLVLCRIGFFLMKHMFSINQTVYRKPFNKFFRSKRSFERFQFFLQNHNKILFIGHSDPLFDEIIQETAFYLNELYIQPLDMHRKYAKMAYYLKTFKPKLVIFSDSVDAEKIILIANRLNIPTCGLCVSGIAVNSLVTYPIILPHSFGERQIYVFCQFMRNFYWK